MYFYWKIKTDTTKLLNNKNNRVEGSAKRHYTAPLYSFFMETTVLLQAITDALKHHSIDDIVIAILQIDKNATRIKDVADLSVNQYFDKIEQDDISASYLNKIKFICLLNIYKNMNINLKEFAIIYNKNYSTIKNYNNILKSNLKYPKSDKFLSDCLEKTYNNFKTNIYEQKY